MPLEISSILKEKGIEVTKGFASVVKSNFNKKFKSDSKVSFSAKKKRIKPNSSKFDVSILIDVKNICDKYGKSDVLEAISVLEKLS
jgi:ribosome-associated translation inhibitor RaiA